MSRPLLGSVAAACALAFPIASHSRPVSLAVQLKNYGGDGAYLAVYLTDAKGAYAGTLWVAGGKAKYYRNLSDWNRLSAGDAKRLAGVTGASVGAGRTLKVTADLADALIDAGCEARLAHTMDARRAAPVNNAVASVSVLAESCMHADAWATALLVAGPGDGLAMAQRRGLEALWLLRRGDALVEAGLGRFGNAAARRGAAERREKKKKKKKERREKKGEGKQKKRKKKKKKKRREKEVG